MAPPKGEVPREPYYVQPENALVTETSRIGGTVAKTSEAVNAAMGVAGKAGPVLMAAGVAVSAYNVAMSTNPTRTVAHEGGAWAGALSLGAAGGDLVHGCVPAVGSARSRPRPHTV